jgi:outer membrane protein W
MKFNRLVAILAYTILVTSLSAGTLAKADDNGTLRRNADLAQAEMDSSLNSNGVVILNTNTNQNNSSASAEQSSTANSTSTNQNKAVAQPTTVVEASPMAESKAEILRKERINTEIQTEQKIVEKLENSRLEEERARAERLFGNKFDNANTQTPVVPVQPQPQPVVQPAPVVAPPAQNTQVTIEKIEIVQPEEKPTASVKMDAPKEEKPVAPMRYYVSGQVGNYSYDANNMKSNYGLGVSVGTLIEDRWAVELGYFYSNHYIDTYWKFPVYSKLDQNDISATAKYYILGGKFRPYVGGDVVYISRSYTDRQQYGDAWNYNNSSTSEDTQAVNLGLLGGADFFINEKFAIGGGLEYSFNVMNTNPIDWGNSYGAPSNAKNLEEISAYIIKINAKYVF